MINLANRDQRITPVASYFLQVHGGRPEGVKVIGLAHLRSNIRGGDLTGCLLRTETRWIHLLNSVVPIGVN